VGHRLGREPPDPRLAPVACLGSAAGGRRHGDLPGGNLGRRPGEGPGGTRPRGRPPPSDRRTDLPLDDRSPDAPVLGHPAPQRALTPGSRCLAPSAPSLMSASTILVALNAQLLRRV